MAKTTRILSCEMGEAAIIGRRMLPDDPMSLHNIRQGAGKSF